jgi:hypothetical protein
VKQCILDMRYPEVNLTSHLSDIPRPRDSSNQGARFNHRTFRQVAAAGSPKYAQPPSISHGKHVLISLVVISRSHLVAPGVFKV